MAGPETLFFLGGRRSGKSGLARRWAEDASQTRFLLATCRARDPETLERIRLHRESRDSSWHVFEEPLDVPGELASLVQERERVLVVDCVSSWIANLMEDGFGQDEILRRVSELGAVCLKAVCPVALVSLEVGLGAIPMSRLARQFSDVLGSANQILAGCAGTVLFSVAGIPLPVKGGRPQCL